MPEEWVVPESLRLYIFCKALKFTHLPAPGGLYDQNPRLIDQWSTIMRVESEEDARKHAEQQREADRKSKRGRR